MIKSQNWLAFMMKEKLIQINVFVFILVIFNPWMTYILIDVKLDGYSLSNLKEILQKYLHIVHKQSSLKYSNILFYK